MTWRLVLPLSGLLGVTPALSQAQDPPQPDNQESVRAKVVGIFNKPLHPIVKSVAPGPTIAEADAPPAVFDDEH